MAKNYKGIPAIGQFDPTACWMACLSWWLKAAHDKKLRQLDIMGLFGPVWTADGTIDPTALKDGIIKNNSIFKMNVESIFPGSLEYWASGDKPTLIGFKTPGGMGHMNVLYNFKKETGKIGAMEPWYPENLQIVQDTPGDLPYVADGKRFTGMHVNRPLSYYHTPLNGSTGLFIGYPQ